MYTQTPKDAPITEESIISMAYTILGQDLGSEYLLHRANSALRSGFSSVLMQVRRSLLTENRWNFAIKRQRLSFKSDGGAYPPADCLEVLKVGSTCFGGMHCGTVMHDVGFIILDNLIYPSCCDGNIAEYIWDNTRYELWLPIAVEMFVYKLASAMAGIATGDGTHVTAQRLAETYQQLKQKSLVQQRRQYKHRR